MVRLRAWKQNDAGGRTYYLYEGSVPVCELDGGAHVTAQNMFGAASLVSRNVTGAGNTLYAFDERGNVASHDTPHTNTVSPALLCGAPGISRSC